MVQPLLPAASIPRKTCKLFGAIKALSTIRRSVVLVHGPKGCVYHINYILGMRGDRPSEIYTTALDEHDIIFGAGEKLIAAIEELDQSLRPELLFVLSCCSSGIIGEDVEQAARVAVTGARVLAVSAGGFEGDYHDGYQETLCQLVEQLAKEGLPVEPRTVNLVGMLRAGPDLSEIRRLLGQVGVRVNAVLTADASRDELERLGAASLSIVLCEPSGKEAADLLRDRCGVPYTIEEIPIGHQATTLFLSRVAGSLGIPIPGPVEPDQVPDSRLLRGRRIAIVSGPTRAVSMTRFLNEIGVPPRLVVVDIDSSVREKIEKLVSPEGEVLIEPSCDLILQKLEEHQIDLLIGGMLELPLARARGIDHIDMMHGSQKTVGPAGAANLVRLCGRRRAPE